MGGLSFFGELQGEREVRKEKKGKKKKKRKRKKKREERYLRILLGGEKDARMLFPLFKFLKVSFESTRKK